MEQPITPESLASSKRAVIRAMSEQDFNMWRHHPVTAGYLQYIEDSVAMLRQSFADMLEGGNLSETSAHLDLNPHAMRGQLHVLRQLHGLELSTIKAFYSDPEQAGGNGA